MITEQKRVVGMVTTANASRAGLSTDEALVWRRFVDALDAGLDLGLISRWEHTKAFQQSANKLTRGFLWRQPNSTRYQRRATVRMYPQLVRASALFLAGNDGLGSGRYTDVLHLRLAETRAKDTTDA
jgi:hypothetical protein